MEAHLDHPTPSEWGPEVPLLHREIVEFGRFDALPQKDRYLPDEIVIARHNGNAYYTIDEGGAALIIWYDTPEGSALESIPRQDVRGVAAYGTLAYELSHPSSLKAKITDQGRVTVTSTLHPLPEDAPPFPGES